MFSVYRAVAGGPSGACPRRLAPGRTAPRGTSAPSRRSASRRSCALTRARHFRALASRLGQANGDCLLRIAHLLPRAAGAKLAPLHFVHRPLDLFARLLAVFTGLPSCCHLHLVEPPTWSANTPPLIEFPLRTLQQSTNTRADHWRETIPRMPGRLRRAVPVGTVGSESNAPLLPVFPQEARALERGDSGKARGASMRPD